MTVRVVEKTMGIGHEDFLRLLPMALAGLTYRVEAGPRILATAPQGRVTIDLGPEGTRAIANLSLPATKVTLTFEEMDEPAQAALLTRFDRAYQRGGG